MVRLGEVSPAVWDAEHVKEKLGNINLDDISQNWRKVANERKFDRELFQKYGYFKDIILHPLFQRVKQFMLENAIQIDLNLLVGDSVVPVPTALIILFMLNKRVAYSLLFLIAAFIFNVNPIYVTILTMVYWLVSSKKPLPKGFVKRLSTTTDSNMFDHVLVGNDIATLYTAALLTRNGHRCCVLQPFDGPLQQTSPVGAPFPAPLVDLSTGKVKRYQILLDAALSPLPAASRVCFSLVGSEEDGFTSSVVEVRTNALGIAANSALGAVSHLLSSERVHQTKRLSIALRAGEHSLSTDVSALLHVDRAAFLLYLHSLANSFQFLASHLVSRVPSPLAWLQSSLGNSEGHKAFKHLASNSVAQAVFQCEGPDLVDMSGYLRGVAAVGAQEGLSSSEMSAVCLVQAVSSAASGVFYPRGGLFAVREALMQAVQLGGGVVVAEAQGCELLLEEAEGVAGAVRVVGVTTAGRASYNCSRSVVSGMGLLCTYCKMLPAEALSAETREALAALRETRPLVRVVYWLSGSAADLGVTSSDFYAIRAAESQEEEGHSAYRRVWSPSAKDAAWVDGPHRDVQVVVVEMSADNSLVRPREVLFEDLSVDAKGPLVFASTREVDDCTDPQHTDFSEHLGRSVSMSGTQRAAARQAADATLLRLFPRTEGREVFVWVEAPRLGGHLAANTTTKFTCPLSATSEVQGLFLTGRDLSTCGLAGDLQSGWAAANAILGYSAQELLVQKRNLVSDLVNAR